MVSPPDLPYPIQGNPEELRGNFYPFEMFNSYPTQPGMACNPAYSHSGEILPYRPGYHNFPPFDPPPYFQPQLHSRDVHPPYNCPPPIHFGSRPSPPGYPGVPVCPNPAPNSLHFPEASPPQAPKQEGQQSPRNNVSSPMVTTPPSVKKPPRIKGRKASANGRPVKRLTRARYTLLKGRIRNTFCQRKSRKISKAKIASSEIKDQRLKQFYARMIVEKTAKEEEDRSSLNEDMDAVARLKYNLQRETRYSTKCLTLIQDLMDSIGMENERLKLEEATISREEQDQMREKLMGFRNTHEIVDVGGTDDVEDSDKDDEDMENEDSDANSSLGTA